MKKFLSHIVLFMVFSALFYTLALFAWGNYAPAILKPNFKSQKGSYGQTFTRLNEAKNVNNIDILFLGSSHTYRGFDTRIFSKNGLKTFNLGTSAQTPTQTQLLLKRYLKNIKPQLVIYEVYPSMFSINGVESTLDIFANDINDLYSFEMAFKLNHIETYNTLLYSTIRELTNFNNSFKESIRMKNDTYIPGGYVEKKMRHFSPVSSHDRKIKIKQTHLESFSESIENLKNRDIDVMLVYAPISTSLYSSYSNNSYFADVMKKHSEYYNFNEILSLDDSLHFYDKTHLNQNGVEIFNAKILEILSER